MRPSGSNVTAAPLRNAAIFFARSLSGSDRKWPISRLMQKMTTPDGDQDQQDRYGGVVHEHAHDGRDHRSEQAEQRGQEREICLQPFYSLNLYP